MQKKEAQILVIEDEKPLLKIWEGIFRKEGMDVLTASTGEDALKSAFKNHPDLVVIDLVMPSSEGLTVIKKLREDKWGNKVPVVFLNGWRDPEAFTEISGPTDYMNNNWSLKQVVEKVERKLEVMKLGLI